MRKAICIALLVALALPVSAQSFRGSIRIEDAPVHNRFSWEYDADFQLIFDNREFDRSGNAFIPSGTMNTVVLAPTAGFSVQQSRQVHHRLAVGLELAHDLGSQTWKGLATEPVLFYDVHVQAKRGMFEGLAGIFPRRALLPGLEHRHAQGSGQRREEGGEGIVELRQEAGLLLERIGLDGRPVDGRHGIILRPEERSAEQEQGKGKKDSHIRQ